MKFKIIPSIVLVVLVAFVMVMPAFAWDGVEGTVIDSMTRQPWKHGGTVKVLDSSYQSCGTTTISTGGSYSLPFACPAPLEAGSTYYMVVNFNAGPNGKPASILQQFTQGTESGMRIANFETGTGPLAVTLSEVGTNNASNSMFQVTLLMLTMLSGVSLMTLKRHQQIVLRAKTFTHPPIAPVALKATGAFYFRGGIQI